MSDFPRLIEYDICLLIVFMLLDFVAPGIPIIMVDECGVVNNSMTVSWRSAIDQSFVDAFVLEITDHDNATVFRVSVTFL